MKTRFTLGILFISIQMGLAQENKLWLSLSSGLASSSASNKSNLIGNGFNIEADAFVPLYRKAWAGSTNGGGFMFGVNVSGNYTSLKNLSPDNLSIANQYQTYRSAVVVSTQSNGKNSSSLAGLVGLEGKFSFGKLSLSPSLNTGYINFKKEGYVQTGSANINGQSKELTLVKVESQNSGGVLFKAQIKLGYKIMPNVSLFLSPAIIMTQEIKQTTQQLVPQGGFNDKKTYETDQLAKGTWESKTNTNRYNFTELNFGLTVALGKQKARTTVSTLGKGGGATSASYAAGRTVSTNNEEIIKPDSGAVSQRISMTPTTTKQSQGQNFGEKVASGLQSGAGALSQGASLVGGATPKTTDGNIQKNEAQDFNTTRSNRDNRLLTKPDTIITQTGSDNQPALKSINALNNSMPNRLSMTPTTTKQSQGQAFGEKVATGLQSGAGALSQGASLVGGATPKTTEGNIQKNEAQDFNTTRNNRERGQLAANQSIDYGGATGGVVNKQSQGQNFGEKVASGLQSGAGALSQGASLVGGATPKTTDGNLQKNEAQDFNTTRNNRERGQLAANQSIDYGGATGGVVNKQSQGQAFGEKVATGLQSGSGALSQGASLLGGALGGNLQTASNPKQTSGKSINEKGVKRSETAAFARPGQPIGGIVVKGGKNPGGNMNLISNSNGEVLLGELKKGNYLFSLSSSADNGISEKNRQAAKAAPGQPIGGIVVKGGKNPGGNFTDLTVNNNGQIGFEVLEKGNYKLIIQTPAPSKTNSGSKKKVVEKATSGLKDTLKTNV